MTYPTVKIGDVCTFTNGGTPPKDIADYWCGDIPWISSADIVNDAVQQPRHFITKSAVKSSSTNQVPAGTLLVVTRTGVGKVAITDFDLCFSQDITALHLHTNCYSKYIAYAIKNHSSSLIAQARGATIKGITRDVLASLPIPLPPLAEQQRIAAILDKAEEIKRKREQAIAKLDELAQSTFVEMFGDPASNQKGWELKMLRDVSLIKGQYGAGLSAIESNDELPRYVRITDINDEGELKDTVVSPSGSQADYEGYYLKKGDLLFARSGATVGKSYLHKTTEREHIYAGYLIRFVLNTKLVLPEYVYAFTGTQFYKNWVKSKQNVVAQPNINAQQYGELILPVPPLSLQSAYGFFYNGVLKQKQYCYAQIQLFNKALASLQHQAFTTGFRA